MISLNGVTVTPTIFPDHTSQVWKLPAEILLKRQTVEVIWQFTSEGEIIHLAQLKMLLQSHGVRANLKLPYLPYARQDKSVSNTETFALRAFAHYVNMLSFESVEIVDPHSEVALELIKFSKAIYPAKQLETIAQSLEGEVLLCYPDKGAVKKYTKVYETLYRPHIYGEKVRDQLTGNITSYEVFGDPAGKTVLIVDDICDGGMTFKILAKDLLAKGAKEVNLFVTHGIFSRGLKTLKDSGINRIFAQDGEASEVQNHIVYRNIIK